MGGLKKGLLRVAYHVGMDEMVKKEPITPASWQMMIEAMSLGREWIGFFINIFAVKFFRDLLFLIPLLLDHRLPHFLAKTELFLNSQYHQNSLTVLEITFH